MFNIFKSKKRKAAEAAKVAKLEEAYKEFAVNPKNSTKVTGYCLDPSNSLASRAKLLRANSAARGYGTSPSMSDAEYIASFEENWGTDY